MWSITVVALLYILQIVLPETLGRLAKRQVHGIVLLLQWIGNTDRNIKFVLYVVLRPVDCCGQVAPIKLRRVVHQRIEVKFLLLAESSNGSLLLTLEHDATSQVTVLIVLDGSHFLEWTGEVSRRVHLLHDMGHVGRCKRFHFHLLLEVGRKPLLVFSFELFVLKEIASHDPIDLFEVLEHCQTRELFLMGHVLMKVIVRVHLRRGAAYIIEGSSRSW